MDRRLLFLMSKTFKKCCNPSNINILTLLITLKSLSSVLWKYKQKELRKSFTFTSFVKVLCRIFNLGQKLILVRL